MHPKYTAVFTAVNMLLGVGPLILPMPFFNAGILLSSIWIIVVCLLSYNSAMFISESMSKIHQIEFNKRSENVLQTSLISDSSHIQVNQRQGNQGQNNQNSSTDKQEDQDNNIKQYDHSQQFSLLYGKKWKIFPSIAIVIYLIGTSISKCIMTGKTLSQVFTDVNAPAVFDDFRFWLFLFFISGTIFSFKSIEKTKVLQTIIISVRFVSIFMFIFGAIYVIYDSGIKELTPPDAGLFNFSKFIEIFSNSVFALMFHHSYPSIVSKLKTTEDVAFVARASFLISGIILLIIPITGCMAFGKDLGLGDKLIFYNFDFQGVVPSVYWITSFYVFLNISAFSVYIIVIRSYILEMINPKINPRVLSKHTLISSFVILLFVLLASWLLKDSVQYVLDFTGGIFGIVILFLMPSLEVLKARKTIHKKGATKNYIQYFPYIIFALGIAFMAYNLTEIIKKLLQ